MRRLKKILLTIVALIVALPSIFVMATSNENSISFAQVGDITPISATKEHQTEQTGKMSSKDEVIYATLSATGSQKNIYVVNTLNVEKAGKIVDYGNYSNVKNLTDLSKIELTGDQIEATVSEGKFFYQGNLKDTALPWDINIAYYLNGKKVSADELAGKDGHVEIKIETSINEKVSSVFAENYLLQISVPLEEAVFHNIKAEEGMIATVGKNKQVTFTVMPEKTGKFTVSAEVTNFKLDGINITGVPSTISIEEPDVDEMKDDMKTLSDAIAQLNDGVLALNNGVTELNNGTKSLQVGSAQYNEGLNKVSGVSSELVKSSTKIKAALSMMSNTLPENNEIDVSEIEQITEGLSEIANGLFKTTDNLREFKSYYKEAHKALDGAIAQIPDSKLSEEEIAALYRSNANQEVINMLVETYTAALTVKGVYGQTKQLFATVDPTLTNVINGLEEMANNIQLIVVKFSPVLQDMTTNLQQLDELFTGIKTLSKNYYAFHDGLVIYSNGVNEIAKTYKTIHNGIVELSGGTADLDDGVADLHDGTLELHESTSDLPNKIQTEIDEMMSNYDKSNFEAVSFVSNKNKHVNNVQFVLKTESIKTTETKVKQERKKEKQGFWGRLLQLFR